VDDLDQHEPDASTVPDDGADEVREPSSAATRTSRSRSASAQKWTRLIHVYTSMIALLAVLFFSATGLTLNHPEWTLGLHGRTSKISGDLPSGSVAADGTPQYLVISDALRDHEGIRGEVTDFGATGTEGHIAYAGPGFLADVTFDTKAGTYQGTVEQQGLIGVLNDLHKGRNTDTSWGWVIDAAAVFLVVISLTGIGLQLFLRRRRRSAVIVATVGGIVVLILALLTVR